MKSSQLKQGDKVYVKHGDTDYGETKFEKATVMAYKRGKVLVKIDRFDHSYTEIKTTGGPEWYFAYSDTPTHTKQMMLYQKPKGVLAILKHLYDGRNKKHSQVSE